MKTRTSKLTRAVTSPRLTAIAALALVGCAGAVTASNVHVAPNYLPEELYVVATGGNELRTVIVGEPFDMPKTAFEGAVLASLKGQNFGPSLSLSTKPEQEDARSRQVVIAFNLTGTTTADDLCGGDGETVSVADTGGKLSVMGVYCGGGGNFLTQATARADDISNTESAQFQTLMSQLAIALFPDENPHRRLDENRPLTP